MSSVLHPIGPEPRERYWLRRVAVLVAAVVAIGIVIALVGNAMSAGSAVQAEPVPPTIPPPAVTAPPSPTASAAPSGSPTGSPAPDATAAPTTGPTSSPSPTSSSTPSDKKSTAPSKSTAKDKAKAKAKAKAKDKKKTTAQPVYAACDGDDLRPTLTGDRTVKVGKKTTFSLSVINGGKKTCKATVKPSNATLTIVSGGDRIWSTKDCPAALPAAKRTLLPEHALTWKVTWSGKRSGDDCSTSKVKPKKGYYWAIANLDGADDVRFRVILR
jgi:cytoskeletal protein RodZ